LQKSPGGQDSQGSPPKPHAFNAFDMTHVPSAEQQPSGQVVALHDDGGTLPSVGGGPASGRAASSTSSPASGRAASSTSSPASREVESAPVSDPFHASRDASPPAAASPPPVSRSRRSLRPPQAQTVRRNGSHARIRLNGKPRPHTPNRIRRSWRIRIPPRRTPDIDLRRGRWCRRSIRGSSAGRMRPRPGRRPPPYSQEHTAGHRCTRDKAPRGCRTGLTQAAGAGARAGRAAVADDQSAAATATGGRVAVETRRASLSGHAARRVLRADGTRGVSLAAPGAVGRIAPGLRMDAGATGARRRGTAREARLASGPAGRVGLGGDAVAVRVAASRARRRTGSAGA
jgi:hypothetical protein